MTWATPSLPQRTEASKMNLFSHNVFLSGLWGWESFGTEQCRHFSPSFPNKCGGLKETVSYSFRYLDTWSPVGSAVLGTVQPAGGNTSQRVGFECYTALIHFHITLLYICFTFVVEVISPLPVSVATPATYFHASCLDGLISLAL